MSDAERILILETALRGAYARIAHAMSDAKRLDRVVEWIDGYPPALQGAYVFTKREIDKLIEVRAKIVLALDTTGPSDAEKLARAKWNRLGADCWRLELRVRDGGRVVGGVDKIGAGSYTWFARSLDDRETAGGPTSIYAAQLAVRRALRELQKEVKQ